MKTPLRDHPKLAPNVGMIRTVDDFVEKLLKDTPEDNLDARRETANVAIKWIAVRHKLMDAEDMHGSGLSSYREALTSPDGGGAARKPAKRTGTDPAVGAELAAFRDRLPDSGVGDVLDARARVRGTGHPANGNGGGVRTGVSRHVVPITDDSGNDSDL